MSAVWNLDGSVITDADPAIDLLKIRGVADPEGFIRVSKKNFHNPYLMKDMKRAVQRILLAVQNQEKVWVYGDYDADGVSSTSFLVLLLRELGVTVDYFIPDRFKDGYGLNNRGIDLAKAFGASLILTCDTGITAVQQVHYAQSLGMEVIVTDHHEPQKLSALKQYSALGQVVKDSGNESYLIPDTIVVNPKRPDCSYPFKSLAGVGVAFKLMCAVCEKIHPGGRKSVYEHLDLVAIGTIADLMDMVDENRIIGKLGLKLMRKTKNRGLYQLLRANDLTTMKLTSKDIGWTIAPCINAAGRIVSAREAVEMLISSDKLSAYRCAKKLVQINEDRKEMTANHVEPILRAIGVEQATCETSLLVHYHPQVPEGIIGLLAARISNHFGKPAILLSDADENGFYKGSGRSVEGFDLFSALMAQASLMTNFGGHPAACGLSLEATKYNELKSRLEFAADATISRAQLQKKVRIDAVVKKGTSIDLDFLDETYRLEPYGNGNPEPRFLFENMRVVREKGVGSDGSHLWGLMSDGKNFFSVIGFGLYEAFDKMGKPKSLDIVATPALNEYPKGSGKISVQLVIDDIREVQKKGAKR